MLSAVGVEDIADPRVSDYRDLTDGQRRRQENFIVEGVFAIRQLLRSQYPVRSLLVTPSKLRSLEAELGSLEAPVYVAPQPVLAGIAGYNVHRGALAAADRMPLPAVDDLLTTAGLVVVLEGVNDHENIGALFRNAAAFGVDAVLLCPRCADPLYRRSVRVSVGHVLHVPWTRMEPWPGGLERVRSFGLQLVALTPTPTATALNRFAGTGRVALLLGEEGPGLSLGALSAAQCRVRIPMAPGVDSLNVATAAAIALYHLADEGLAKHPPSN
jgi:tRNA G18 (ribose-2'-O)-methylase SpoU